MHESEYAVEFYRVFSVLFSFFFREFFTRGHLTPWSIKEEFEQGCELLGKKDSLRILGEKNVVVLLSFGGGQSVIKIKNSSLATMHQNKESEFRYKNVSMTAERDHTNHFCIEKVSLLIFCKYQTKDRMIITSHASFLVACWLGELPRPHCLHLSLSICTSFHSIFLWPNQRERKYMLLSRKPIGETPRHIPHQLNTIDFDLRGGFNGFPV